jgi:hypothetical protein
MSRYITRLLPVGTLLVLVTAALLASAQRTPFPGQRSNQNLTGSWRDDRGRVAVVRQVDSDLCWYAERPGGQREVFCGVIDRNTINGQWMDMPGSGQLTSGQLTLRVESNSRILKVRSTSRYDASTWNREDSGDFRNSRDPRSSSNGGDQRSDTTWENLAGSGRDIGVGNDGSVWLVGTDPTTGGYSIYSRNGNQWNRVGGGGVRIDVDGRGNPWIVNAEGEIYRRERNQWQQLPGSATDVGAGSQGDVCIIGKNPVPGGFGIYRWTGRDWASVDGGAVRIDVDGRGNPWIVNAEGVIYRRDRNQWQQLPGSARDISVNAAGDAWLIGTNPVGGGFGIFNWTGREWRAVDGGGTQLSVGGDGIVYIINSESAIYRRR